jgi:siroheme synthase
VASSFTVVTGHKKSAKGEAEARMSWDKLTGSDTLVILMGIGNLEFLVRELIRGRRPSTTPVAVITQGTTHSQKCVTGTLQDIAEKVKADHLEPPSVIVVGEVVRYQECLQWFGVEGNVV